MLVLTPVPPEKENKPLVMALTDLAQRQSRFT
jgi:hypothetical protein